VWHTHTEHKENSLVQRIRDTWLSPRAKAQYDHGFRSIDGVVLGDRDLHGGPKGKDPMPKMRGGAVLRARWAVAAVGVDPAPPHGEAGVEGRESRATTDNIYQEVLVQQSTKRCIVLSWGPIATNRATEQDTRGQKRAGEESRSSDEGQHGGIRGDSAKQQETKQYEDVHAV